MQQTPPNIVLIIADDHANRALSCYGSSMNQTPHLDRLANAGMRFDRAFVTVALCGPSRATLLTGKYCHLHGYKLNETPFDGSQQTFPKLLQKAGYATAVVGKWHLDSQPEGFDYYNIIHGHGQFFDCPFKDSAQPWGSNESGFVPRPGYLTDVITDISLDWLENKRDPAQPFCLLIEHKSPHLTHHYPPRYEKLFREPVPLPATFHDDWSTREALRAYESRWSKFSQMVEYEMQGNELGNQPFPARDTPGFREWAYQIYLKGYLRLVASLDENVGRVLDYLDSHGLRENTLVIYTSDHGCFLGEHGLYNKMWMYDPAIRVPLLARWPGHIAPGSHPDALVSFLDIAPTLLDLAGAPVPADLQGQSLVPILEGRPNPTPRDTHYYHYYRQYDVPSMCGIRTATHKLICYYELTGEDRWELFDLTTDPDELHNLARDPQHAGLRNQLQARLRQAAQDYADPIASALA